MTEHRKESSLLLSMEIGLPPGDDDAPPMCMRLGDEYCSLTGGWSMGTGPLAAAISNLALASRLSSIAAALQSIAVTALHEFN